MKKIVYFIIFAAILYSCEGGQFPGMNSHKEALEAAEKENLELKEALSESQQRFAAQNKELASILHELSSISYSAAAVQLHVENGGAGRSRVDSVYDNISVIKDRIARLEKEAARARKVDKELAVSVTTIQELRTTVSNLENQVTVLRRKVSEHEGTIREQKETIVSHESTISKQNDTILLQQDKIEETLARQREMLYQAGLEFEGIADEGDFQISGRKNRRTVEEYRKSIYKEAIVFYREAAAQGHTGASFRMESLKRKLEE